MNLKQIVDKDFSAQHVLNRNEPDCHFLTELDTVSMWKSAKSS